MEVGQNNRTVWCGLSLIGKAPECELGSYGFNPHRSPQTVLHEEYAEVAQLAEASGLDPDC